MAGRGLRKRSSKFAKQQTSHKHMGHKQRQSQFLKNRFITLDEVEAPSSNNASQASEKWFTPIIITYELKNPKQFHEATKQWGIKMNFRYVNNQHQVLTYRKEDYENVKQKLTELKFSYITFTPKSQKPRLVVMKRISEGYAESEILDDLKSQIDKVINVTQMKSRKKNKMKPLNIYLITLDPFTSVSTFAKAVRYCCQHKITLENYVKPRSMVGVQCYNCQQYGHVSRNCGQSFRCVKCDQSHARGECGKDPEAPPVCVNCKGPHTASYRGCSVAESYLQKLRNAKSTYNNMLKKNTTNVQSQNKINYTNSG